MKSAKIFLAGLYLHLILSILVPIVILLTAEKGFAAFCILLFCLYIVNIIAVLIIGWFCVGMAVSAYHRGEYQKLRSGWRLLKTASIPFYLLNFIYSVFAWFILIGASRGLLVLFVPIPIVLTCIFIFQTGCVGWCYIRFCNRRDGGRKISGIHYVLQIVSVLDVISTWMILHKEKKDAHAAAQL